MKTQPALLIAVLLAAVPVLHAQEVRMTFSGPAACGATSGCAPWLVSFDVDTASGPQVQGLITSGGVTYVSSFGANLDASNFVVALGGNDLHPAARGFVPAASATIAFNNLPLEQVPAFGINVVNFTWLSDPQPSPTETQFNTPRYPLESYLLNFDGESVNSDTAALLPGLGVIDERMQVGLEPVRITVTAVSEPAVLGMLVTGLLGVACTQRVRARMRRHAAA